MAMLDTLRASQQLQDAGIEAGHADALVTTFAACGVSPRRGKARGEPTGLPAWKASFGERLATRDELRETEARLVAEIAAVRAEIREAEQRAMNRAYLALGAFATFLVAVVSIATTVIVTLD